MTRRGNLIRGTKIFIIFTLKFFLEYEMNIRCELDEALFKFIIGLSSMIFLICNFH